MASCTLATDLIWSSMDTKATVICDEFPALACQLLVGRINIGAHQIAILQDGFNTFDDALPEIRKKSTSSNCRLDVISTASTVICR